MLMVGPHLKRAWQCLVVTTIAETMQAADAQAVRAATSAAATGFGYKTSWLAIKSTEPKAVIQALGLQGAQPSSWEVGISTAYGQTGQSEPEPLAFVSPPVNGWIFVVSPHLPYPDHRKGASHDAIGARFDSMFRALATKFEQVQFFGSYRVVGYDAWARARSGKVERVFCFIDGEVYANDGPQSAEERLLRLPDVSGLSPEAATKAIFLNAERREAEEARLIATGLSRSEARRKLLSEQRDPIPSEEDTMAVAGSWSINPIHLDALKLEPRTGFLAVLPRALRR